MGEEYGVGCREASQPQYECNKQFRQAVPKLASKAGCDFSVSFCSSFPSTVTSQLHCELGGALIALYP